MTCINCQNTFISKYKKQKQIVKYCSSECRKENYRKKRGWESIHKHLSPGTVGALGELLVSVDLIKKGFEVYRALSPSSSCDILAIKENKIIKFEVRTGHINNNNGKVYYSPKNIKADNLAIIVFEKGQKIVYIPEFK